MAEELQSLIEKINRDGVEKANAEAARIVAEANAKAAATLKEAEEKAKATEDGAKLKAEEDVKRAEKAIAQAARDAALKVKDAIASLLESLLRKDVESALADPATAAALAGDAVKELVGGGEVSAGPKLAEALKAQLAAMQEFKVTLDDTLGSGFTVKLDGGRVEHDFTGATVAAELAKRLRPDLAKLLTSPEFDKLTGEA
jgi:V/A-type H+-transporting ATPase subunit E